MDLIERARAILRANDRGGYSRADRRGCIRSSGTGIPAFVAMGWATFDEARAFAGDRAPAARASGMTALVPQIVFHAPSDDYFPGPDVWGIGTIAADLRHHPAADPGHCRAAVAGTGRATARWRMRAPLRSIRRCCASHRWWQTARDPERTRPRGDAASVGDGDGQQPRLGCGAGARAD